MVEAKLHRAKAAVAIAQEQARMKQQQAERLSNSIKQHVVSHEEVERAKSEAEVARLQVEQARADLEQAEASLQAAIAGQHQAEASARGGPAPDGRRRPRRDATARRRRRTCPA